MHGVFVRLACLLAFTQAASWCTRLHPLRVAAWQCAVELHDVSASVHVPLRLSDALEP